VVPTWGYEPQDGSELMLKDGSEFMFKDSAD
jgi:hypothetical protein